MLESASPAILSNWILPTFVIAESLKSKVPVTSKFPSTVKLPSIVALAPLNVIAAVGVEPDLITNSPLEFVKLPNTVPSSLSVISAPPASNIISPPESSVISVPSFVIVSSAILPMLLIFASPKSNAPATVNVPDISTLPFISTVVAAICISVSATKSNCPSVDELIYIAVSLNCNFSVLATRISSENSK